VVKNDWSYTYSVRTSSWPAQGKVYLTSYSGQNVRLRVVSSLRSELGEEHIESVRNNYFKSLDQGPQHPFPEDGKRSVRRCVYSLVNTPRRTSFGNKSNPCCLDTIVLISFGIIFSVVLCCLDTATVHRSPLHFYWPVNQKRLRYESVPQASGSVNMSLNNSSKIREVSPKRNKIHIFLQFVCYVFHAALLFHLPYSHAAEFSTRCFTKNFSSEHKEK
jgi:hypothetical protein